MQTLLQHQRAPLEHLLRPGLECGRGLATFADEAQHLVTLQEHAVVALQRAQMGGRDLRIGQVQVLSAPGGRSAGQVDVLGREIDDG